MPNQSGCTFNRQQHRKYPHLFQCPQVTRELVLVLGPCLVVFLFGGVLSPQGIVPFRFRLGDFEFHFLHLALVKRQLLDVVDDLKCLAICGKKSRAKPRDRSMLDCVKYLSSRRRTNLAPRYHWPTCLGEWAVWVTQRVVVPVDWWPQP